MIVNSSIVCWRSGKHLIIFQRIEKFIVKKPTNMVSFSIESRRWVAITLYQCPHGCTFSAVPDISVSIAFTVRVFASVWKELIRNVFTDYVKMPSTDKEWIEEAIGFIENYAFPCVLTCDGFHVYVGTKLNDFHSFKKTYSFSNMGLIGYNKWFLDATVNTLLMTHVWLNAPRYSKAVFQIVMLFQKSP